MTQATSSKTAPVKQDDAASPLATLADLLKPDMLKVNELILAKMQSDVPLIPQVAAYLIAAGGKRVRPLLTIAAARLFSDDIARTYGLAAAVEFVHTATLLHDDVVDDSKERRGKPAANTVFGNEASVLVGDFLFSRSFQLMVADGSLETLRILSDAAAVIAEGEVFQIQTTRDLSTTLEDYSRVIASKTAALFAASCEIGPVITDQSKDTQKAMRDYGHHIGMAFQIIDDILDYSPDAAKLGKQIGDDFKEGKITAPVLFALKKADQEESAFWQRTLGNGDVQDNDFDQALDIIRTHKALDEARALATHHTDEALRALGTADPRNVEIEACLRDLCGFILSRDH